jgi:RNA polymerase sigma factor (sigma-70 family)
MTVDIVGIGTAQKAFPEVKEENFESLTDYVKHAERIIGYFAPKISKGLAAEMLSSEDAISNVASALMFADWTWDENRVGNETGKKCQKRTYRLMRGQWAIKSYLVRKKKTLDKNIDSLNFVPESGQEQIYQTIESDFGCPVEALLSTELRETIDSLLSCGIVSEKQKEYIELRYLKELTFAEIGELKGVTRQAVHDTITRAIKQLKEELL